MEIQKDAEEILVYCYKQKIAGEGVPQQEELEKITGWEDNRIIFALEYLVRKGLLMGEAHGAIGSQGTVFVLVNDVSPTGVDIIENQDKFQREFNHTINLGIYKFSWGVKER